MRETILPHYVNSGKSISWYPFVKKIGSNRLPLEMDLIVVENETGIVVGYEFKFLDYEKPWKNYHGLYKGLGQIFSYFTYGIEQGWLIVGISENVADRITEKLEEFTATINNHFKVSRSSYVGLHLQYDAGGTFRFIPVRVNTSPDITSHFPIRNPLIQENHDNIVKGNLTKTTNWLIDNQLPVLR